MQSDLPHTLFAGRGGDAPKSGNKVTDKVLKRQEEANRRARKRREGKQNEYTIEEIFNQ